MSRRWRISPNPVKLDAEISKKIAKGYPLTNTIFEDTRRGVLERYNEGMATRVKVRRKDPSTELYYPNTAPQ